MKLFLLFCALFFPALGFAEVPAALEGTWHKYPPFERRGAVTITAEETTPGNVKGVIIVHESEHCKDPIPFLGIVHGDVTIFEGDKGKICGRFGELTGTIIKKTDGHYDGEYVYKLNGFTFAEGEFSLKAKEERTAPMK